MSRSLANQLYQLLPAVYRERDNARFDAEGKVTEPGDMGKLLGAYGDLLDALLNTLDQRYYDHFPDRDPRLDHQGRPRNAQPWLLPYFAQLLDVDLVAPDAEGQREEVSHAVGWRQRKGTRVAAERIAEAVGQMDAEVQEGWQRLARTPRLGDPLLPEQHFGDTAPLPETGTPSLRARHPGLPSITPDPRHASRALLSQPGAPAARRTRFQGRTRHWFQANRKGTPCFPGSYQDASLRTPDMRTPSANRGHYHPRRVLLFAPPPRGFCTPDPVGRNWSGLAEVLAARENHRDDELAITVKTIQWHGEAWTQIHYQGLTDSPPRFRGVLNLQGEKTLHWFENLWLDNRVTLHEGRARLDRCAARQFQVQTADRERPVVNARGVIFNRLEAPRGQAQLEYCTLLDELLAETLYASDCILMTRPRKDRTDNDVPSAGCLRYCRLPFIPEAEWISQGAPSDLKLARSTHRQPVSLNRHFGEPGCGVLHWNGPDAIARGAEDGGELGAYHDARHRLRWQAVSEKLSRYLPLGTEAALIPDDSLLCPPPYRD